MPRFQPAAVLDAIERDRCTVVGGVPTMLHVLAQQDISGRAVSALRVAVSGGASLPEDVLRTFEGKSGIEVLEGYGMSETASTCSFNRPGDRRGGALRQPGGGGPVRAGGAPHPPPPPRRGAVGGNLLPRLQPLNGHLRRARATPAAVTRALRA